MLILLPCYNLFMQYIKVRKAKENNLKEIDVDLPKGKLIVFTGLSGSGKSTLAMDVIYAEGQRRYLESLSSYARQFLGELKKPDVESIEGLSPAIAIDQKTVSHNPRSTVGTVTEIYDYLRLLYARIGIPHCPLCGKELTVQTIDQIVDDILKKIKDFYSGTRKDEFRVKNYQDLGYRAYITAPLFERRKGSFEKLFLNLRKQGWYLVFVDGELVDLKVSLPTLDKNKFHSIEVVADTLWVSKADFNAFLEDSKGLRSRIFQAVDAALKLEPNLVRLREVVTSSAGFVKRLDETIFKDYSTKLYCPSCNVSLSEFEPRDFSFNSPRGACKVCNGLGVIKKISEELVLDYDKSVLEGGIVPYRKMYKVDTFFRRLLYRVADRHNISLNVPIKHLTRGKLNILLYGTGDERYEVSYYSSKDGSKRVISAKWEGIINNLERRYKETQSDFVRSEIEKYMVTMPCEACEGARLQPGPLAVTINGLNIYELSSLPITDFLEFLENLPKKLSKKHQEIATQILREIKNRAQFLIDVGLGYLTLARSATTLSGGEAQRIRLASQIGTGLTDVIYVLDEPSIGLHARDQARLIKTLKKLRDLGNTVIVVEHDKETILNADHIVDFGPGAGEKGGEIVAQGTVDDIIKTPTSITGPYLSGKKSVRKNVLKRLKQLGINPEKITEQNVFKYGFIELREVSTHNLKDITVKFPLGRFVLVTGVSGSGKSSLIVETLYPALKKALGQKVPTYSAKYKNIFISRQIDKVIFIDQSPIGRTPRSNPATYTKVFDEIRLLFSQTQEAKIRGYTPGRFSFNVPGGRCEACRGEGQIKIEMQFMPDVYITCDVCNGKRYTSEVLEIKYKGKNIADVLDMSVSSALEFFKDIPGIYKKLKVLDDVGLGYIKLGQPAPTLSGGEAQRVKLAAELNKRATGKTVYILDEPTTGLHFADIEKLLVVLRQLVAGGNTVIVIEHNLEFIEHADWIIDLGPEGGDSGGEIIFEGTVDRIVKDKKSHTGRFLKEIVE